MADDEVVMGLDHVDKWIQAKVNCGENSSQNGCVDLLSHFWENESEIFRTTIQFQLHDPGLSKW